MEDKKIVVVAVVVDMQVFRTRLHMLVWEEALVGQVAAVAVAVKCA